MGARRKRDEEGQLIRMPIGFEVENHIATITIDGYNDMNPITYDMYAELYRRFLEFDGDPDLHVAILRGAGDLHFSVGGNMKVFQEGAGLLSDGDWVRGFWHPATFNIQGRSTLYNHRAVKPVIGAYVGYCLGAGVILSGLRTSLRIAGEHARFGLVETKLGLGGGAIAKSGLAAQLPYSALMWLILTGEMIDAQAAKRIGLVNEVVPDDQVFARAKHVAEIVAELPPLTLRAEKEALLHTENMQSGQASKVALALEAITQLGRAL